MFPVDSETKDYNEEMVQKFDKLVEPYGFSWKLRDIMPQVMVAGQDAGCLTEEGARLGSLPGKLQTGIPMCPPEVMRNRNGCHKQRKTENRKCFSRNFCFAMIVLEKSSSRPYKEIDMVTTPPEIRLLWHIPTTVLQI